LKEEQAAATAATVPEETMSEPTVAATAEEEGEKTKKWLFLVQTARKFLGLSLNIHVRTTQRSLSALHLVI
jgi:hypothetical protein